MSSLARNGKIGALRLLTLVGTDRELKPGETYISPKSPDGELSIGVLIFEIAAMASPCDAFKVEKDFPDIVQLSDE